MNDLLVAWGLVGLKPVLQLLVLPPLPMLLLGLLAWLLVRRHPRTGRTLGLLSVLLTWAVCTPWVAHRLDRGLTRPPPPLQQAQLRALVGAPHTAILVLGAGRQPWSPEYDAPDLSLLSLERLRYGWWLARQTGLPLGFSGGVARGTVGDLTEAEVARLVTVRDHGVGLRWVEDRSRDTNENAVLSLALLRADGITRVVLVTHGFHQQRALAAFRRAAARAGQAIELVPAPMGLYPAPTASWAQFVPRGPGLTLSIRALHEWLGWLAGA